MAVPQVMCQCVQPPAREPVRPQRECRARSPCRKRSAGEFLRLIVSPVPLAGRASRPPAGSRISSEKRSRCRTATSRASRSWSIGSRPVAEYLLAHGAHPTIFSAAMLGDVDVVRAFVTASPGIERTKGPHGLTLAHHARMGGERATPVLDYLSVLPGADARPASEPLSDSDLALIAGVYAFGGGPDERVEIRAARGQVMFTRTGHAGRGLTHVGGLAFFPAGSEAVRIRCAAGGSRVVMTVHDPDVVMTVAKGAVFAIGGTPWPRRPRR